MDPASYTFVKSAHVLLATVSAAGFVLRAGWMLAGRDDWLAHPGVRVAPHVVDTALLAAGLTLAFAASLSPLEHWWFGVKLLLIVGYVLAGAQALRRAPTRSARLGWLIVALACLGGVFASALSHRPLGI